MKYGNKNLSAQPPNLFAWITGNIYNRQASEMVYLLSSIIEKKMNHFLTLK